MALAAEDYKQHLIALQPPGLALPTDSESNWVKLLHALAEEFARIDALYEQLTDEVIPSRIIDFLPEWETMLGLPDSCTFDFLTTQDRINAVHAKLTATGGATEAYFIERAAALGFTVSIDNPMPNVWRVLAFGQATVAVAGQAVAGDPLRVWGAEAQMECIFSKINPAHLRLDFVYA